MSNRLRTRYSGSLGRSVPDRLTKDQEQEQLTAIVETTTDLWRAMLEDYQDARAIVNLIEKWEPDAPPVRRAAMLVRKWGARTPPAWGSEVDRLVAWIMGSARANWIRLAYRSVRKSPRVQRAWRTNRAAKGRFIQANLRLVLFVARRYWRRNPERLELDDLVQEGAIALVNVLDGYVPDPNTRFSAYAAGAIKHALWLAMDRRSWLVRPSADMLRLQRKAFRVRFGFNAKLGREPTLEELAAAIGATHDELRGVLSTQTAISLSEPVGGGESGSRTLEDTVSVDHERHEPDDGATGDYSIMASGGTLIRLFEVDHDVRRLLAGLEQADVQYLCGAYGLGKDEEPAFAVA